MENLDLLVFLIKNWFYDLIIGVEYKRGPKDVDRVNEAKENILDNP